MWRVLTRRHQSITLSFMLVGHTKFAPDWSFGIIKQRFRRTKVSCLEDLAAVVNSSAKHNIAQLAGREDGSEVIPVYEWTAFLKGHFRKIPRIKIFQHFTVKADKPDTLYLKQSGDSAETEFKFRKNDWTPSPSELPPVTPPPGLSAERQWYLYDSIRRFCTPETKDTVCPLPQVPRPTRQIEEQEDEQERLQTPESTPPASPRPPPSKRQRICSVCGESGAQC